MPVTFEDFNDFVAAVARAKEIEGDLASLEKKIADLKNQKEILEKAVETASVALDKVNSDAEAARQASSEASKRSDAAAQRKANDIISAAKATADEISADIQNRKRSASIDENDATLRLKALAGEIKTAEAKLKEVKDNLEKFKKLVA